jgi:phospholipid transport system substrate-binding protein
MPTSRFIALRALVLGTALAGLVSIASPVLAQEDPVAPAEVSATAFVQARAADIIAIINRRPSSDTERSARLADLRSSISAFVNIRVLAREALGPHWNPRTEAEREEFVALLTDLIETSYARRLGDEGVAPDSYTVTWDGERTRNQRTRVNATVTWQGRRHSVEVMVRDEEGDRIVYDVVTDDVSLKDSYAESFDSIITQHGWPELLQRMRNRLEELRQP